MKEVSVYDALGMVLAHDMTQIIPGEYKGSRFKKGHVIRHEDVEVMICMGKKRLYVFDKEETDIHEDDAAMRIATAASGSGVLIKAAGEGKLDLLAEYDGLLKVNTALLHELIEQDDIMFATIHENQLVKAGQKLAGTRIIPLYVKEEILTTAEQVCKNGTLLEVLPLKPMKIGLVTTGSEVYTGKIIDQFGPVLDSKFKDLGSTVVKQLFADDDEAMIAACINQLLGEGADMIGVTGGMSVDPDDKTPTGIKLAGGQIVIYGTPVLPGAMFMLAYIGNVPIVGIPGCAMYSKISIFDLVVPRLLAGETLSKADIRKLAHGGLCRSCEVCTFPNCGFGKAY